MTARRVVRLIHAQYGVTLHERYVRRWLIARGLTPAPTPRRKWFEVPAARATPRTAEQPA